MEEINFITAIKASIDAGNEILIVYNSDDFQIEKKGDDSPLTLADKKAHLKIMEYLVSTNIPVLSEEGKSIDFNERVNWKQLWIVDPLDGTKEFIKRNGDFTVNIALIEDHKPIFGVIYVPVYDELFIGIKGVGSFKVINATLLSETINNLESILEKAIKLPVIDKDRPFTVVASRSHMSDETQVFINQLKNNHPDLEFSSRGSSLKLCAIAEGIADVYPRFAPTMEWDTAAGQAIVEAMGGRVTLVDGELLNYNRKDLLNPFFIATVE